MLVLANYDEVTRAQFAAALRAGTPGLPPATLPPGDGPILISESDHDRFRALFVAAVATPRDIFLCDPQWGESERTQLAEILAAGSEAYLKDPNSHPQLGGVPPRGFSSEWGWLMIPTGGSRGKLKFARHDQQTLTAAVWSFVKHFRLSRVNTLGVLPLHHVSGLMAWLRTALTRGDYEYMDWKTIFAGNFRTLPLYDERWVVSLVPTQLDRYFRHIGTKDWLRQFHAVFVGGAACSFVLVEEAAEADVPLSPCYGMTETAAMIAALKPDDFREGLRSSGTLFPQVDLTIDFERGMRLWCPSLFRGYYGEREFTATFETGDFGVLDFRGHLHVSGRRDFTINSGGEKVDPSEIEGILRLGGLHHVIVLGVPHPEWGEEIVAVYPEGPFDWDRIMSVAKRYLSPYKRPKRYVCLPDWPSSSAGKVNRVKVRELLLRALSEQPVDGAR